MNEESPGAPRPGFRNICFSSPRSDMGVDLESSGSEDKDEGFGERKPFPPLDECNSAPTCRGNALAVGE